MKHLLAFFLLLITAATNHAYAQETRPPLPPVVVPSEPDLKPMVLTGLDVDVRIRNDLAETRMTMTFHNPNARVLAGDLYFPLPEGALVSGYALDVNGQMVEGSVVKKETARRAFETEMRRGIDPGLVEYTKGNTYKTRIFPLPANGTRTVMMRYISDLRYDERGPVYTLPLNYKTPLKQFHLRVEVVKPDAAPEIRQGSLANFSFERWRDSYVAETSLTDTALAEDLRIALPPVEARPVVVERGSDGDYYFYISDFPEGGAGKPGRIAPRSIALIWDASGSREDANIKRELGILEDYLESQFVRGGRHAALEVTVHTLRDTLRKEDTFRVSPRTIGRLISALRNIPHDGGTQMGAIQESAMGDVPDLYLVFTDGLSNFGEAKAGRLSAPAYVISSSSSANHPYLHYLAGQSGGRYFNSTAVSAEEIVEAIGASPYMFLGFSGSRGDVTDTYPAATQTLGNRFTFVGKLKSRTAVVTLRYGTAGETENTAEFMIDRRDADTGNMLRTYWAQQKVNDLLTHDPDNEEAFVAVGKEYGLVTPGTSLIVMETLDQYVRHRIEPPASLGDMRAAYRKRIAELDKQEKQEESAKIDRIVELWNKRIEWWNTDFTANHKIIEDGGTGETDRREPSAANGEARERADFAPPPPAASADENELATVSGQRNALADEAEDGEGSGGDITLKPWDPDTPYLKKLKAAKPGRRAAVYFEQRKAYGASPAFFLDCAEFFYREGDRDMALQVLSNITELELENAALMRVAAHRLSQMGELHLSHLLFEEILGLRPEEPQSYRDLALVLEKQEDYARAVDLLYQVVLGEWDRFDEIELIALMELNHILAKADKAEIGRLAIDKRLIKLLDLDVRIVMTWDADLTDMDLWVLEPSGEKAYYGNNRTRIGGLVTRDFTQGYGPEAYLLRKAMPGTYKIQANYYGSGSPALTGPVTLQLDIFSNYGRPDERHKAITVRLSERREVVEIGEVTY